MTTKRCLSAIAACFLCGCCHQNQQLKVEQVFQYSFDGTNWIGSFTNTIYVTNLPPFENPYHLVIVPL